MHELPLQYSKDHLATEGREALSCKLPISLQRIGALVLDVCEMIWRAICPHLENQHRVTEGVETVALLHRDIVRL